uniref:Peptidase C1A papain C-terminal domain-containing protein n=1 Tax=viral metagenome TaxID=1070528 RepID=A0A6C0BRL7_9ZZZZ
MRFTGIIFLLFSAVANANLFDRFENWLHEHGYHKDETRYDMFENWRLNDEYINDVNSRNLTYTLGHNKYSGMSSDEFGEFMGFRRNSELLQSRESNLRKELDISYGDSINWVEKGAVTPVKDQGQCGSCWSFSTTGALEGIYYIENKDLVSFSEQELVDCDKLGNGGKDHGCNGGLMDNAFSWIIDHKGLCSEKDYSYFSGTTKDRGECKSSECTNVKGSDIKHFNDVPPSSDDAMMTALYQQPVSIAIQADQKDFQLYKSGVFTSSCGTNLDHGVLAVGYGSEGGEDYYLVKNSWSSTWGDGGYIKLGRGKQYNNGKGQCGMLLQASYPSY